MKFLILLALSLSAIEAKADIVYRDLCPKGYWRINETSCMSRRRTSGNWSTVLTIDPTTGRILDRDTSCRHVAGLFYTC